MSSHEAVLKYFIRKQGNKSTKTHDVTEREGDIVNTEKQIVMFDAVIR